MLAAAERPLIVAGGGIINADAADLLVELAENCRRPGGPDPDGLGHASPTITALWPGWSGLQTSHRYGNATMLASDFVLGIGNRWANRHTGGLDTYTQGPHLRARRHRTAPRSAGSSRPTTRSCPMPTPRSEVFVETPERTQRAHAGPHRVG